MQTLQKKDKRLWSDLNLKDRKEGNYIGCSGVMAEPVRTVPPPKKCPEKLPIAKKDAKQGGAIVITLFDLFNGRAPTYLHCALICIETLLQKTDIIETQTPILLVIDESILNYFPPGYHYPEENLIFYSDWHLPDTTPNFTKMKRRWEFFEVLEARNYQWMFNFDADSIILGQKQLPLCRRLRATFNSGHKTLGKLYNSYRRDWRDYTERYLGRSIAEQIDVIHEVTGCHKETLSHSFTRTSNNACHPDVYGAGLGITVKDYGKKFVDWCKNVVPAALYRDEPLISTWCIKNNIPISNVTDHALRCTTLFWGSAHPDRLRQTIAAGEAGVYWFTDCPSYNVEYGKIIKEDTGLDIQIDILEQAYQEWLDSKKKLKQKKLKQKKLK